MSPMERLQKVLAMAGVASRRASEDMIRQGRVQVNGRVIMEQGVKVDPAVDHVTVDGIPLPKAAPAVYILLHKPAGVLSTASDEFGRKTVLDLVPATERLYPVGRLDADSEGLILLTNDGELTARLTHPRYGHTREYRALVHGEPKEGELQKMRRGIVLDDGPSGPAEVEVISPVHIRHEDLPLPDRDSAWLKIVIREGRKRQIRRMCEIIGHPVMRLIRIGMGPLTLGTLPVGKYRFLKPAEVKELQATLYDKPRTTSRPRRVSGAPSRPHTARRPVGEGGAERREERTGSRPHHGRGDVVRHEERPESSRSQSGKGDAVRHEERPESSRPHHGKGDAVRHEERTGSRSQYGRGDASRHEERTGSSRPQHGRADTARRPGRENAHRSKRPQG